MELLAQMHDPSGGGGSLILSIIALVAMIIPFFVLGFVCFFWKAKKREDAAEGRASEWRNAHSS